MITLHTLLLFNLLLPALSAPDLSHALARLNDARTRAAANRARIRTNARITNHHHLIPQTNRGKRQYGSNYAPPLPLADPNYAYEEPALVHICSAEDEGYSARSAEEDQMDDFHEMSDEGDHDESTKSMSRLKSRTSGRDEDVFMDDNVESTPDGGNSLEEVLEELREAEEVLHELERQATGTTQRPNSKFPSSNSTLLWHPSDVSAILDPENAGHLRDADADAHHRNTYHSHQHSAIHSHGEFPGAPTFVTPGHHVPSSYGGASGHHIPSSFGVAHGIQVPPSHGSVNLNINQHQGIHSGLHESVSHNSQLINQGGFSSHVSPSHGTFENPIYSPRLRENDAEAPNPHLHFGPIMEHSRSVFDDINDHIRHDLDRNFHLISSSLDRTPHVVIPNFQNQRHSLNRPHMTAEDLNQNFETVSSSRQAANQDNNPPRNFPHTQTFSDHAQLVHIIRNPSGGPKPIFRTNVKMESLSPHVGDAREEADDGSFFPTEEVEDVNFREANRDMHTAPRHFPTFQTENVGDAREGTDGEPFFLNEEMEELFGQANQNDNFQDNPTVRTEVSSPDVHPAPRRFPNAQMPSDHGEIIHSKAKVESLPQRVGDAREEADEDPFFLNERMKEFFRQANQNDNFQDNPTVRTEVSSPDVHPAPRRFPSAQMPSDHGEIIHSKAKVESLPQRVGDAREETDEDLFFLNEKMKELLRQASQNDNFQDNPTVRTEVSSHDVHPAPRHFPNVQIPSDHGEIIQSKVKLESLAQHAVDAREGADEETDFPTEEIEDVDFREATPRHHKHKNKKNPSYQQYPTYNYQAQYYRPYSGLYREAEEDEGEPTFDDSSSDFREASPTHHKKRKQKVQPQYYPAYNQYHAQYPAHYREAEGAGDESLQDEGPLSFLFNFPARRRLSDQYKRSLNKELDTILGMERKIVNSLEEKAKNDTDLQLVADMGNRTLTEIEEKRKIVKRSIPLTRLIHDPNVRLDVPRTIENFGTATKKAFEDERAPMYHLKHLMGSSKNAVLSVMRVPPQNMIIPSDYEIVKSELLGTSRDNEADPVAHTFRRVGEMVRDSFKSGQETAGHLGDVAHSARNVIHTARHSAPRLMLPYSRVPALQKTSTRRPSKAVLITPRILDLSEETVGRSQDSRPDFVGLSHLIEAVGLSRPDSKDLDLERIVFEPRGRISESKLYNRFKSHYDDDVDTISEAIGTLEDAKVSVGAQNLNDFLVKMKNHLTGVVTGVPEHKKKKLKSKKRKQEETKEMGQFIETLFDGSQKVPKNEEAKEETVIVGNRMFVTPELTHPFLGRASEAELRSFLRDNGDDGLNNFHDEKNEEKIRDHNTNPNFGAVLGAINPLMFERLYNETVHIRNNEVNNPEDFQTRAAADPDNNGTVGTFFNVDGALIRPFMGEVQPQQIQEFLDTYNKQEGPVRGEEEEMDK